jgi:hypothetical protein
MLKLNEFLEQNQDYKNYIISRFIDDIDIQNICDELNSFDKNINFTVNDLINYKNNCDLTDILKIANDNKNNNDEGVRFTVNFDEDLKIFKTKNLIEQNNYFNELLSEINYKLLYIINVKLDRYQDRVPKDDIQAFKIINEMVYKPEIENINIENLILKDDVDEYSNILINKLMKSKYLTKDDCLNLIKFILNKDCYNHVFKSKYDD